MGTWSRLQLLQSMRLKSRISLLIGRRLAKGGGHLPTLPARCPPKSWHIKLARDHHDDQEEAAT